jgi:hypothetical protein
MPSCLLDKNVVRRAIEGIGKSQVSQPLTNEELTSLRLLLAAEQGQFALFISIEMQHILDRYGNHPDVQLFLRFVRVLRPTRYFKRWARRLREHGFTREDAKVLALATFGAETQASQLGVDQLATFDQPFINHVAHLQSRLTQRLEAMTVQLPVPYKLARLPVVRSAHII